MTNKAKLIAYTIKVEFRTYVESNMFILSSTDHVISDVVENTSLSSVTADVVASFDGFLMNGIIINGLLNCDSTDLLDGTVSNNGFSILSKILSSVYLFRSEI